MDKILKNSAKSCQILLAKVAYKIILFFTIITLQACVSNDPEYSIDDLAKDWRAQFRKNPHNIYEEYNLRIETD